MVHNEKVIKELKRKGGKIVSSLSQVKSGTLIIKAHGISPALERKIPREVLVRDTTCPLVKKVQLLASSLSKKNYQVIIVGDKKHSETKGIKGYTKNKAIIVENKKQAKKLTKFKKIGVVAQTTQNLEKYKQILKILENKADEVKSFKTICPEVGIRQNELRSILEKTDRILVLGSRKSANTKRLVQICKNYRKPVWWLNSLKELKKKNLNNVLTLGVVSGTSTPNWEIEKIKKWLKDRRKK